jgi:hypothetical protein
MEFGLNLRCRASAGKKSKNEKPCKLGHFDAFLFASISWGGGSIVWLNSHKKSYKEIKFLMLTNR